VVDEPLHHRAGEPPAEGTEPPEGDDDDLSVEIVSEDVAEAFIQSIPVEDAADAIDRETTLRPAKAPTAPPEPSRPLVRADEI